MAACETAEQASAAGGASNAEDGAESDGENDAQSATPTGPTPEEVAEQRALQKIRHARALRVISALTNAA